MPLASSIRKSPRLSSRPSLLVKVSPLAVAATNLAHANG